MSWLPRFLAPKGPAPRTRRAARLAVERLESRLNPSAGFNAGVLIIQADVATSNDYVRVTAAGTASDGSTGVQVRSNLVNGGAPTTFGGPGNPVVRLTLDLKDGNDGTWINGLAQTRIRVGEGNGNNVIVVGDSQDIGVAAGNGYNLLSVGRGAANTAGGLAPGNTVVPVGTAVLLGWSYTVDNSTGALFTPIAPIGNNRGSNLVHVRDRAGDKAIVDIAGNGVNAVFTGAGDDIVWVQGNGHNLIHAGQGNNQVQVDGNGNNCIGADGTGSITVNGQGNNRIDAGKNPSNAVFLNFAGAGGLNQVTAAKGSTVKVNSILVTSSGKVSNTKTFVFFRCTD